MQIKVYSADWFFNAGIVGFIKILKHSNKDYLTKKDNYIEFNSENLKDFADDYFKYFFDKYNVVEGLKYKINKNIGKIIDILGKEICNKEDEISLKNEIKYLKESIKYQNNKIKTFHSEKYNLIDNALKKIDDVILKKDLKEYS